MRNLLKKLHIMPNQSECSEGPSSTKSSRSNECASQELSSSRASPNRQFERRPLSGLSGGFATRHGNSPPLTSNVGRERIDQRDDLGPPDIGSSIERMDSGSSNLQNTDMDEECQIQLALELSAKEDPEAVQIEKVKQISLGSCLPQSTPAEVVAYQYWVSLSLSFSLTCLKCIL